MLQANSRETSSPQLRVPKRACDLAPFRLAATLVQVSADGRVLRTLSDPAGTACHTLSSAVQVGGVLYMGSLGQSHVCALDLSAAS